MSKFFIGVSAGVANVYPYGQGNMSKKLLEGEALLCEVPVGVHPEPHKAAAKPQIAQSVKDKAKQEAHEDMAVPAAGVADAVPGQRAGTLVVAVIAGAVTLRTYAGADFTEESMEDGDSATVEVIESNRITLAVYDAQPVVDPRR